MQPTNKFPLKLRAEQLAKKGPCRNCMSPNETTKSKRPDGQETESARASCQKSSWHQYLTALAPHLGQLAQQLLHSWRQTVSLHRMTSELWSTNRHGLMASASATARLKSIDRGAPTPSDAFSSAGALPAQARQPVTAILAAMLSATIPLKTSQGTHYFKQITCYPNNL